MKHLGTSPPSSAPRKDLKALRTLLPYLWPADSLDFRIRVMVALTFLAVAKVANVVVPLIYKQAVDALSQDVSAVLVLPLGILLAYGLVRT
ncbi:MAG: metal ABC transporter permease, partial [Rhodospirillaceae bacterium]|nr:metal ABC transporter permease [Rhodospirillaceae bacterium]